MSNVVVKVIVHANDRYIAAMAKSLAWEVGGPKSVSGASKEFLAAHGHLVFTFRTREKADTFVHVLATYLPGILGRVSTS